jgi:hypothetical protein
MGEASCSQDEGIIRRIQTEPDLMADGQYYLSLSCRTKELPTRSLLVL